MQHPWRTIGILAFTQIATWGSVYYGFSIIAPAIGRELGMRAELVYGAFSLSLLISGLVATPAGILLDRFGGQWIMATGSLLCGAGLVWLSAATNMLSYFGAWTVLGVAMSLTMYEAAFATINRKFHYNSRQAISTLTLFGGFSSTVFWPLTLKLSTLIGWRDTYFWFGVVQLLFCLPLHLMLGRDAPAAPAPHAAPDRSHTLSEALRHPAFWKLAMAFSANIFIFSALSVHLIPLLTDLGHTAAIAVLMASLMGPAQVAGRICERTLLRTALPQTVGKFTFSALPAAVLALLLFGAQAWAVALFCVLYGMSNGVLTIVRGTLPQALFGSDNYGAISGAMAGPALLAKASGPILAAWLLGRGGSPGLLLAGLFGVAVVSVALYFAAVGAERGTAAAHQPGRSTDAA